MLNHLKCFFKSFSRPVPVETVLNICIRDKGYAVKYVGEKDAVDCMEAREWCLAQNGEFEPGTKHMI